MIVAFTAGEVVRARPAHLYVVTLASDQRVGTVPSTNDVVAAPAVYGVVPRAAPEELHHVGPVASLERVVAEAADDALDVGHDVVAAATDRSLVRSTTVAGYAVDCRRHRLGAVLVADRVVARGADEDVGGP